jgi:uncharacterized protein (TIGR03435 family)
MDAVNLVVRAQHRRHRSPSTVIRKHADESRGRRGRTLGEPAIACRPSDSHVSVQVPAARHYRLTSASGPRSSVHVGPRPLTPTRWPGVESAQIATPVREKDGGWVMVKARLLGAVGIVALVSGIADVVAQAPDNPAFEIASVKPTKTQGTSLLMFYPGGRLTATNVGLGFLISRAYGLQANQLEGGPSWIHSESFDIEAKAAGNVSSQQLVLMLRTLLTERFKLTLQRETRELPIYALVMAKAGGEPGPQLRPSSGSDCVRPQLPGNAPSALADSAGPPCGLYSPMGHWIGRGTTIDSLGSALSRVTSRIVVNRTGLTGTFNLDLQWTDLTVLLSSTGSPADPPPPGDGPSFFTALQEQLGLKLESTKGPVDVLVIDHVEHPTED